MSKRETRQPCVLLTGFDPFDGETVNPSWEAVRRLDGEVVQGHRVVAICLPTEFRRSLRVLKRAVERHRPQLALCMGQAGGSAQVSLERVAINVIDARIPDNVGHQPVDLPVVKNAPAAYFSTLPIKAMMQTLREAKLPAAVSNSAGTFVCNAVFFGLMHVLQSYPGTRGGFVHLPFLPQQARRHAGAPSLAEAEAARALRLMLDTALRTRRDKRVGAGTEY